MNSDTKDVPLNPRAGWLGWWPADGARALLDPENARIRQFLREEAAELATGARVLDASAGNRPYHSVFQRQRYESCDVPDGFYRCQHDFECYLDAIPRADTYYDAVVLTQVLEHVANPDKVLRELLRVTRPGGLLILSVPMNSPLHGEPWHFFHFTHYGLAQLAQRAGWDMARCEKVGGAYWLLGKRLTDLPRKAMKSVDPFRARKRGQSVLSCLGWSLAFLPFWLVLNPLLAWVIRPLFYWLDRLDFEKSFTTGYTAVFRRPDTGFLAEK